VQCNFWKITQKVHCCAIYLPIKLHKFSLGVRFKCGFMVFRLSQSRSNIFYYVNLCHKFWRDIYFLDSIRHYWISFNNLEIVICLVLVIYVFPWWKLTPHFPLEFFLVFHHCATMKTTSQITNLSRNFSSCYNESSLFLPTHETMQSLIIKVWW
jgi:hypothetical protein